MQDKRLLAISNLLANYSMGNYDYEVEVSTDLDEIDTIISGINMLGEELNETTISRDFFSSIYDAVTDMLFVTDEHWNITDINSTVSETFKIDKEDIVDVSLLKLLKLNDAIIFPQIQKKLAKSPDLHGIQTEAIFEDSDGKTIYTAIAFSRIINRQDQFKGYLIIAEDITAKKLADKMIMTAVLDTQEAERKRVADDLHDSLGQELSSIKLMLSTAAQKGDVKLSGEIMKNCISILDESIHGLRSICFDLIPSVLEEGGIINAVKQMASRTAIAINITYDSLEVDITKQQELSLYRVIQEFINNSQKHAEANEISISFKQVKNKLNVEISDDGKGFVVKNDVTHDGRGMNTMRTRIETFGGTFKLISSPGAGVKLNISFKTT